MASHKHHARAHRRTNDGHLVHFPPLEEGLLCELLGAVMLVKLDDREDGPDAELRQVGRARDGSGKVAQEERVPGLGILEAEEELGCSFFISNLESDHISRMNMIDKKYGTAK